MAEPPTTKAIREALAALVEPGGVFEIRVPKAGRAGTVSGYFNDAAAAAKAAAVWSGKAPGVYFTINPVNPALLARSSNRVRERAEHTTADTDILLRRWLYVDADAVRPAGICATDAEHTAVLERTREIRAFLIDQGVPESSIILADSGNGSSLYLRIDLANDADALSLVKGVLRALDGLFSDGATAVDLSVSNAARIARVPGTLNAKGDNTQDRPHRLARLLEVPDALETCPRQVLERIAALAPEPERPARPGRTGQPYVGPSWDFEAWLAASGLDVAKEKAWGQGTVYELVECPWNAEHKRTARIVRFGNGALSAGCFHNSCQGKGWHDLRELVDPGRRSYQSGNSWASASPGGQNPTSNHKREPLEVRLEREVNAADLQAHVEADPLTSLPFLGEGGFIRKGLTHLIASYPKVGKTELMASLCHEWGAFGETVLYFTEEPRMIWKARLNRRPHGWDHVTLVFALGMYTEDILERIRSGPESVVVIDTIRNLLVLADENDNSKIAVALIPYVAAARQGGKTLNFLHHDRKGGGDRGEGIAGGHAFLGIVDIALELRPDSQAPRRRHVRGWGRIVSVPELMYELQDDGRLVALGEPGEVTLEAVKERVLSIVTQQWLRTGEVTEALGKPRPSDEQVRQALQGLAKEGITERDPPIAEGPQPGTTYYWRQPDLTSNDPPLYGWK